MNPSESETNSNVSCVTDEAPEIIEASDNAKSQELSTAACPEVKIEQNHQSSPSTPPAHYTNHPNGNYWRLIPNYYPRVYPPNTPIYELPPNQQTPHWHHKHGDPSSPYMNGPQYQQHEQQLQYENFQNYQNIQNYQGPGPGAYYNNANSVLLDYNDQINWQQHQMQPMNVHTYQQAQQFNESQAALAPKSNGSSSNNSSKGGALNYEDYYSKDKIRASGGHGQVSGSGNMAYHANPSDPLFYSNSDHNNNNNYYSKSNRNYYKHASPNGSQKSGFVVNNKEEAISNDSDQKFNKTKRYSEIVTGKEQQQDTKESFDTTSSPDIAKLEDNDLNKNNNNNTTNSHHNSNDLNKNYKSYRNHNNDQGGGGYYYNPGVYYQNEYSEGKNPYHSNPYYAGHGGGGGGQNLDTNLLNNMMTMSLASDVYTNQRNNNNNYNNNYKHSTYNKHHNGHVKPTYYKQPKRGNNNVDYDRYDPKHFQILNEQTQCRTSRFFVIKSYSKDDIIKSIKYNIWCSTEDGNRKLDNAFSEIQQDKTAAVYLFFSVNGSGQFCGLAQMLSRIDYDSKSKIWSQDKWHGTFDINWIFVKDVPNVKLRHISLRNNENKPVTNSRDTQEVEFEQAYEVLNIIRAHYRKSSILDEFDNNEIGKV